MQYIDTKKQRNVLFFQRKIKINQRKNSKKQRKNLAIYVLRKSTRRIVYTRYKFTIFSLTMY
jgi:hypothetical protein